jgi:hypothetical protein
MPVITMKIILAASAACWLLVCLLLYRISKHAAWLAGSTVASCLFFLGGTVLASVFVSGALALTPLWFGILVLTVFHLYAAHREPMRMRTLPGGFDHWRDSQRSPSVDERPGAYI